MTLRILSVLTSFGLVACEAPSRIRLASGTVIENGGMIGGRRTQFYKRTPAGGEMFVNDGDYEKSLGDTVQAAGLAYGALQVRLGHEAELASDTAISTGAQNSAVKAAGIAADVEKARIGADVTKTITIPK